MPSTKPVRGKEMFFFKTVSHRKVHLTAPAVPSCALKEDKVGQETVSMF